MNYHEMLNSLRSYEGRDIEVYEAFVVYCGTLGLDITNTNVQKAFLGEIGVTYYEVRSDSFIRNSIKRIKSLKNSSVYGSYITPSTEIKAEKERFMRTCKPDMMTVAEIRRDMIPSGPMDFDSDSIWNELLLPWDEAIEKAKEEAWEDYSTHWLHKKGLNAWGIAVRQMKERAEEYISF